MSDHVCFGSIRRKIPGQPVQFIIAAGQQSNFFKNGKEFYGIKLPLGFDYGGPFSFHIIHFLDWIQED